MIILKVRRVQQSLFKRIIYLILSIQRRKQVVIIRVDVLIQDVNRTRSVDANWLLEHKNSRPSMKGEKVTEKFMDFINRIFNRKVYLDGFVNPETEEKKVIRYIYDSVFPDEATMEFVQKIVNDDLYVKQ